jgi:hypothetical protein
MTTQGARFIMPDFSTEYKSITVALILLSAVETQKYLLYNLSTLGSVIQELIAEWDDDVPQYQQVQALLHLFFQELDVRLESLDDSIKAVNTVLLEIKHSDE